MKTWILFLGFLWGVQPVWADTSVIYKRIDSEGNVVFSDKPSPGAEEIKLSPTQTFSPPQPETTEAPTEHTTPPEHAPAQLPAATYDSISIAQPDDQATIRNPQGYVSVIVDLQPALKKNNKVQLMIDGNPFGSPSENTIFALQNITRGSHTVSAQVIDLNGKIIISSEQITFYMMPPRVDMK